MTFDAATFDMLKTGIWETLFMTFTSSFFAYLIGIPLGIILIVTDKDGIRPVPWLQKILGLAINLLRSVPFIILLIMVIPLTKKIVGTTLGAKAVIPPLVIAAAPYVARVVESSFKEVDAGVIEAAKSMGLHHADCMEGAPSGSEAFPACGSRAVGDHHPVLFGHVRLCRRRRSGRYCHQIRLLPLSDRDDVRNRGDSHCPDHTGGGHEAVPGQR